jgi:hypothetical protein
MEPIILNYSEKLVRKAVWAFWRRKTGVVAFIAFPFLLIFTIYSFLSGDRSLFVGASAAILTIGIIMNALLFVIPFRFSMGKYWRMRNRQATFEMGEECFKMTSELGSSELNWNAITEIWRFPEFWLMIYSPMIYGVLPLENMDESSREYLMSKVKAAGGKVK